MKTTSSSKWLFVKIGLYGFLLYAVVMVMQYVRSPSFSGNVDVLMGSPSQNRSFNWCSNTVQIIAVVPTEKTIRDPKEIQELCNLAYTTHTNEEVLNIEWSPLLKSMNEKGEEVVLSVDSSHTFVKKGDLIFKVESLKTKLAAIGVTTL